MLKKRIVAMILTAVMTLTAVNFLPENARAEEITEEELATDTDAEPEQITPDTNMDDLPVVQLVPGGAGTVKVTGLNTATASGSSFSSFALSNGCIGFCTNHEARPIGQNASELNSYEYAYFPLESSQVGLSASKQEQVRKILYYGYNGLGNQLTGYSANDQIAYTVDAMQYVICRTSSISGNPLLNYIGSDWASPPSSSMSFTAASWAASHDAALNKQKTSNITFNADIRVNCDLSLPAGMELYFVSSGYPGRQLNTANTGTVTLAGGDVFYLTMPDATNLNWTGSVSAQFMTNVYEVHSDSWARSGSGVQGIMFATTGSNTASFTVNFSQQLGAVAIQKSSSNTEVTNGSSCYSLQGAVYKMYRSTADAMSNTNPVATFVTDANGYAIVTDIPLGNYVIKETQAPSGYALDGNMYPAVVTAAHTQTSPLVIASSETPQMDPINVLLSKINNQGQGLVGAEYTFKFYTEQSNTDPALAGKTPVRTWVIETDINGFANLSEQYKVSGDNFYYGPTGTPYLPLGTLTIQETQAPEGYVLDSTVYVRQITSQGAGDIVNTYNAPTVTEETIRGDLAFTKVDAGTDEPIANVKFSITDSSGESHIVWTDEQGYYSTAAAAHSLNTNSGNAGCGIWFGSEQVDDSKGALPYGTYIIKELRCDANKNKYKDLAAFTITISENGTVVSYGDVKNERFPLIKTTVKDSVTGTNIAVLDEEITAVDTVHLDGLETGHRYTLTGYPVDKITAEQLKNGDSNIEESVTFTANEEVMDVDVSYLIETAGLAGADIVFFEYLYDEAYPDELIASHADIGDEGQTLHFPEIHTTFTDASTGEHISLAEGKVTQVDTVTYTNLVPGLSYKVSGKLVYRDNGEAVKDESGKEVTADITIKPDTADGTADITFEYDASLLAGKSVVAFEYVYYNDRLVAAHADITDEGQTIDFPEIHTTAKLTTEIDTKKPLGEITVVDTVYHSNLVPGKTYVLIGTVMMKDTNEPFLVDGKPVKVTQEFTPNTATGSVDVSFSFDAAGLSGKDIVIFEELYHDGKLIALHADIDDKGQTISLPPYTPDAPKTGDATPVKAVMVLAVISLAGIACLILMRKRKNK